MAFTKKSHIRPCFNIVIFRLEVDQPAILSTMVDIVEGTCAADDRRRTPMLRTITTVDNMHSGLLREGVQMSRSAVYLRVIPRRGDTIEGRRHVQTGKFRHFPISMQFFDKHKKNS